MFDITGKNGIERTSLLELVAASKRANVFLRDRTRDLFGETPDIHQYTRNALGIFVLVRRREP
jgi:hypothetical protein